MEDDREAWSGIPYESRVSEHVFSPRLLVSASPFLCVKIPHLRDFVPLRLCVTPLTLPPAFPQKQPFAPLRLCVTPLTL
jgi:hypothetical protein